MNNYKRAIISAWTAGLLLLSGGLAKSANLQVAKEIPVLPVELVAYTSEYQPQSRTATQSDTFLASNSQRQQINFLHFSFQSLEKSGWQIIQQGRDRVEFGKQTSTIMCRVKSFEQRVLDSNLRHSSASEVANFFRERERQGMIQMGVNRGIYELENLVMDEEDVNDKHFFTMKYETIFDSSVTMNNSLYLFFPQTEDNEFFFAVLYIERPESYTASTTTCQDDFQELLSSIEVSNLESSLEATDSKKREAQADRLLYQGNQQIKNDQYQAAFQSLREALTIYQEIDNKDGVSSTLNSLGINYERLGEYERAIDYYQQSSAIREEIEDKVGLAGTLSNLGDIYNYLGKYERAIDYYQQSLAIAEEIKDNDGLAETLLGLGNVYDDLGEYEKAIDYYQQSLAIKKQIGDMYGQGATLNGLGLVYRTLGEYEKAIEYYQQSLDIAREIGTLHGEAVTLTNLGSVYRNLEEYERAIDYHQQSLAIYKEINQIHGVATSLNNLGVAYEYLGEYEQAIDYHQQSLAISKEISDIPGVATSLSNLGVAYRYLGEYEQAIEYYQKAVNIYEEIRQNIPPDQQESYLSTVKHTYQALANLLLSKGRNEEAERILDLLN